MELCANDVCANTETMAGPADLSGKLKAGDRVLSVNGTSIVTIQGQVEGVLAIANIHGVFRKTEWLLLLLRLLPSLSLSLRRLDLLLSLVLPGTNFDIIK